MYPVIPDQLQYISVLREQGDGGSGVALQHTFEVLDQGKAGPLHLARGLITAKLRPLDKPLGECLHGTQHLGWRRLPHHFQCANGLMELLTGNAQLAGIQLGQVRPARQLGITHKPLQGAGGAAERLAQLIEHPGQRPQVAGSRFRDISQGNVCLHGFVHSWGKPDQPSECQAILNRATDWRSSSAILESSRT